MRLSRLGCPGFLSSWVRFNLARQAWSRSAVNFSRLTKSRLDNCFRSSGHNWRSLVHSTSPGVHLGRNALWHKRRIKRQYWPYTNNVASRRPERLRSKHLVSKQVPELTELQCPTIRIDNTMDRLNIFQGPRPAN